MAFGDLSGAQSEYMRVPEADLTLRKMPDNGLEDDDILFVGDILTTGYDAVRKAGMQPGDVVAVVGCGPVGLCTLMSARALGAGRVVAIDMVPERLKLAESLGAIAVNPNENDPEDVDPRDDRVARAPTSSSTPSATSRRSPARSASSARAARSRCPACTSRTRPRSRSATCG